MSELTDEIIDHWIFGRWDEADHGDECEAACRYCGQQGLEWSRTKVGWRLREPGSAKFHTCVEAIRASNPHKDVKIELKIP